MLLKEAIAIALLNELEKEAALNDVLSFIKQAALDEGDVLPIAGVAGVSGLASGIAQDKWYIPNSLEKYKEELERSKEAIRIARRFGLDTAASRNDFEAATKMSMLERAYMNNHEYLTEADRLLRRRLPRVALATALLSGGGMALYQHYYGD